ncbi:MAG TPA: HlyD family efflux transporter periplasmic adaptor subunit [Acetobacteraceae bacterium]|nr:HlyD family efflux transporter periplasmic adaptor subunit [Acetobacteraceae bacterium]
MDIEPASELSLLELPAMHVETPPARDRVAEIILHSESVVQILGVPPRWLARWGATVMACVVGFLIGLAWLIHYPDVVPASVVITTPVPPATVVARASGHLEMLTVHDGDTVQSGAVLARIHNSADPVSVMRLEAALAEWQVNRGLSESAIATFAALPLGELQGDYAAMARAYAAYDWHLTADPIGVQIRVFSAQRAPLADRIEALQRQQVLLAQAVTVSEAEYQRALELVRHQDASLLTLEDRERQVIDGKRALQSNLIELANTRLDFARMDQTLTEMAVRDRQQRQDLLVAWQEALKTLSGKLALWERTYVLRAPIAGMVSLSHFWTDSQFIHAGDDLMAIVPAESRAPIGRVSLPINRAGSVKAGQTVFIRLDNYPGEQFGLVKGRIAAISPVPLGGRYAVDVTLVDGLETTFGRRLAYQQEMQGQAEIIVEDLRVIDRIFYVFRRQMRSQTVVPPPLSVAPLPTSDAVQP